MKAVLVGIVAAIGGAALGLVLVLFSTPRETVHGDGESLRRELAVARDALRELQARLGELERAQLDARAQPVVGAVSRLPDVARLPTADATARADAAALDPRRLLAEYVASFADGGSGSDFFRMAVAAYAWQLRAELQAIVADESAPDALRLQVMAMLDGGSFRGDAGTIDALLEVLRDGDWEAGVLAALDVLAKIGDRRTAELIEAATPGLEPLSLRAAAWAAIARLCGDDADAVLLRLLEREHDPAGRERLIALFRGSDLAATLRAFELASRMEQNVRLEAAGRVGRFRDERFDVLIDDWVVRETDQAVRERLLATRERRKQLPGWHEMQATGAPNVPTPSADDQRAWASAQADGGREWLELAYETPRLANRVTIHETCVPGCVTAVEVLGSEGGSWRTVWSGDDPTRSPGPFEVRFPTTSERVKKVRITLDTKRRAGWNEIDAVELAGPDGSAFASHALASSRYGEGWGDAVASERLLRAINLGGE